MNRKDGTIQEAPQQFTPTQGATALQKNAAFMVQSGAAPDMATAVQMARSGVNDGATWQRLVQAEKKLLQGSAQGAGLPDDQIEKLAQENVVKRREAMSQQQMPMMQPTYAPPGGGNAPQRAQGATTQPGETKQFKQGTFRKIKSGPDTDQSTWQQVQ
jgi:hypothetical protein